MRRHSVWLFFWTMVVLLTGCSVRSDPLIDTTPHTGVPLVLDDDVTLGQSFYVGTETSVQMDALTLSSMGDLRITVSSMYGESLEFVQTTGIASANKVSVTIPCQMLAASIPAELYVEYELIDDASSGRFLVTEHDVYADGTLYVNGEARPGQDLVFQVYEIRTVDDVLRNFVDRLREDLLFFLTYSLLMISFLILSLRIWIASKRQG